MPDQGYVVNLNQNRNYWTIRSVNSKKSVRMIRLGEEYGNQAIQRRIYEKSDRSAWQHNREYYAEQKEGTAIPTEAIRVPRHLQNSKEAYGDIRPLSSLLLSAWQAAEVSPASAAVAGDERSMAALGQISAQVTLLSHKKLNSLDDVSGFINETDTSIKEVTDARQKIYNKLRRCDDDDKRTELLSRRDDCTTLLKQLRKEKRIAQTIIEDNPKIKENIRIETQAINKAYGLDTKQKYHTRSYER